MWSPEQEAGEEDEALAWRNRLALRLLRAFFGLFLVSALVTALAVRGAQTRLAMVSVVLVAAGLVAYPAFTGRPSGRARGWLIVVPALLAAISGYALMGFLSGPGVSLAISLMLAGLLLGHRTMIVLTVVCGVIVSGVAWSMVHGLLPPPSPRDISMTSAVPWARSLSVTFLGVSLFGGLMVAVVTRIERALRLAKEATLRREQAERARAEAEIVALEAKQLEAIGRLSAGIAHDFNNNLTAIIGCAELLKFELGERDEALELADGILQASQRAAELTRQLLAYARKAQMLQVPLELHAIIEEAVSFARRSIDPKVQIVTELTAKRSTVLADKALLQSAVLNLLINARDAMPDGGCLTVSTSMLEVAMPSGSVEPVPCVLLEVLDTGRGIAPEVLPQIFDPFFTTKPIGKGTGLGLAAVAGTVKSHGGKIEVESTQGVGSVFRITLPCASPDVEVGGARRDEVVRGEGDILLVEDDVMVSATAKATLCALGYRVTHASDGHAALAAVRAEPERYRLVLLDLRMPGMSGEATFDALARLAPRLPVLLWSGYGAEQDVNSMLRRGAVGFVQKPYTVAELGRTIAKALTGAPPPTQSPAESSR